MWTSSAFASALFLNASHNRTYPLFIFAFILFGLRPASGRGHRSTRVQSSVREFLLISRLNKQTNDIKKRVLIKRSAKKRSRGSPSNWGCIPRNSLESIFRLIKSNEIINAWNEIQFEYIHVSRDFMWNINNSTQQWFKFKLYTRIMTSYFSNW